MGVHSAGHVVTVVVMAVVVGFVDGVPVTFTVFTFPVVDSVYINVVAVVGMVVGVVVVGFVTVDGVPVMFTVVTLPVVDSVYVNVVTVVGMVVGVVVVVRGMHLN